MTKKTLLPFIIGFLLATLYILSYYFYFFNYEFENIKKTAIFSENTTLIHYKTQKQEKLSFQMPSIFVFRRFYDKETQGEFRSILQLNKLLNNQLKIYLVLEYVEKDDFHAENQNCVYLQNNKDTFLNGVYFVANQKIYYSTPQIFDWNTKKAQKFIQNILHEKSN